jgi:hypothetical protein
LETESLSVKIVPQASAYQQRPTITVTPSIHPPTSSASTSSSAKSGLSLETIQSDIQKQDGRIASLEECCRSLVTSSRNMEFGMRIMNQSMNTKFQDLQNTIMRLLNVRNPDSPLL